MRSIRMEFSRKEFASAVRMMLTGYLVLERDGNLANGMVKTLNRCVLTAGSTTAIKGITYDKSVEKAAIEPWYMEKVSQSLRACINEGFWDLLPVKLATRDYFDEHEGACVDGAGPEKFMETIRPYLNIYHDELEAHGLQRIRIMSGKE